VAVLIVSNEQDLGADYVVLELEQRQVPVLRCNAERFADWRVALEPGRYWEMRDSRGRILTSDVTSGVWWRRPEPPQVDASLSAGERQTIIDQWQAFAEGLASVRGPLWVSEPSAIASAEGKAEQIGAALRTGFAVPETMWTNDLDQARAFATRRKSVVKTVTVAHWESDGEAAFVFATALAPDDLPSRAQVFAAAPAALQTRIDPKRDIRVTVVGSAVYAAETSVSQLDWRVTPDVAWRRHELPPVIANYCRSLVDELRLRFGGIDLALDAEGSYWFLEINPNGEWGWLEACGLPISSALADVLTCRADV
jgi:hypothetical protein